MSDFTEAERQRLIACLDSMTEALLLKAFFVVNPSIPAEYFSDEEKARLRPQIREFLIDCNDDDVRLLLMPTGGSLC